MSGVEIIDRIKEVKQLIGSNDFVKTQLKLNYIVDDIFMYKNNSL